jgi:P27 family predicted phage terminase small subunit
MKNSALKPPPGLETEARRFWVTVAEEYNIADPAGRLILATACEALQRMRQAQEILAKDGLVTADRFGQIKSHPCITTERDSRAALLAALKALRLDVEPAKERPGMPSGKVIKR